MDNKEKNFVSAVVYIHNEEKRIPNFLNKILEIFQRNFEHAEIICVNDHSGDESVVKIKDISQNKLGGLVSVSLLNLSYFHGVETAMSAGVDMAIGDFVFEFDSLNFDFDDDLIMKTYRHSIDKGYDIVSTVPNKKEKFTSAIFYKLVEKLTNSSDRMYTERFRLLSRRAVNRIGSMNKTILYRKILYMNCGLKTDIIRYDTVNAEKEVFDNKVRGYRTSLAIDSLILFTELGYKFSFTMTIFMMLISVIMLFYSAFIYFTSNPIEGWTTTILFLAVAFFGLFGILTIVIKYLQIIVDLIFKKKRYTFESIEKLN